VALHVSSVEYFYLRVQDSGGTAYEILEKLAVEDVNILAFSAVPFGPDHVELTIFPDSSAAFTELAKQLGWAATGPQHALLVQGDDRLGALADILRMLAQADVEVYASSGVTDGGGRFGYVIYFSESDHEKAKRALQAAQAPRNL
jgi:predicted amino acid-binding ACT domain protein